MFEHPGQLIADARRRHGVSQAQLAIRAGTAQSAISRLERGDRSPSWDTVGRLLRVMGEEPVLNSRSIPHGYDRAQLAAIRALSMSERLERAIGWNEVAAEFANAARRSEAQS